VAGTGDGTAAARAGGGGTAREDRKNEPARVNPCS
jgi:hypothetical protein